MRRLVVAALVGQAAPSAPGGRHDVDLRCTLAVRNEGDLIAAGGYGCRGLDAGRVGQARDDTAVRRRELVQLGVAFKGKRGDEGVTVQPGRSGVEAALARNSPCASTAGGNHPKLGTPAQIGIERDLAARGRKGGQKALRFHLRDDLHLLAIHADGGNFGVPAGHGKGDARTEHAAHAGELQDDVVGPHVNQRAQLGAAVGLSQHWGIAAADLVEPSLDHDAARLVRRAQLGHALRAHLRPQVCRETHALFHQRFGKGRWIQHAEESDQIQIAPFDLDRCARKVGIANGARHAQAKEITVGIGDGDLGQILDLCGLLGGLRGLQDNDGGEQNASGERKRLHSGPLVRRVLQAHAFVYRANSLPANVRLKPRLNMGGGGGTLPVAFTA